MVLKTGIGSWKRRPRDHISRLCPSLCPPMLKRILFGSTLGYLYIVYDMFGWKEWNEHL